MIDYDLLEQCIGIITNEADELKSNYYSSPSSSTEKKEICIRTIRLLNLLKSLEASNRKLVKVIEDTARSIENGEEIPGVRVVVSEGRKEWDYTREEEIIQILRENGIDPMSQPTEPTLLSYTTIKNTYFPANKTAFYNEYGYLLKNRTRRDIICDDSGEEHSWKLPEHTNK